MSLCRTLLLLLLASLLSGQACRNDPAVWTAQAENLDLHRFNDPSGAGLLLPEGWRARWDAERGRLEASDRESARVLIWPVYAARPLDVRQVKALASALLRQAHPKGEWQEPQRVADGLLRSSSHSKGGMRCAALVAWHGRQQGTVVTLYTVSAPLQRFEGMAGVFAQVLDSFEPPQGKSEQRKELASKAAFVRWTDPSEQAFSTDVPLGWTAKGQVARPNSILAQAKLEAFSADGAVYAYLGDAFPWFIEPNGFVAAGQFYTDPMGGRWPVARYAAGTQYLTQFLLPERLGGFEVTAERPRPDLAQSLSQLTQSRCDAGELTYRFEREGQSFAGTALCITQTFYSGAFSSWKVLRLALAEAPQGRQREAVSAMARMSGRLQINPGWLAAEVAKSGANSRIISQMNEELGRQIGQSFQRKWQSEDALAQRDARARRGIEEVYDPLTDTTFEVQSGARHYWRDLQGRIVGTLTQTAPGTDHRELLLLN